MNNFTRLLENKLNENNSDKKNIEGEVKFDSNFMRELLEIYSEKLVSKVEFIMKNKK